MVIDLADIRVRTALTADCRTRLTIEYPTEEPYRRRAMFALAEFLRPEPRPVLPSILDPVSESAADIPLKEAA